MDWVEIPFCYHWLSSFFFTNVASNSVYFSSILVLNKSRLAQSRQIVPVLINCCYVTFGDILSRVSD